jgi:quercetin dioxygenase-like cupin family protein
VRLSDKNSAGLFMAIYAVNEKDVAMAKSGRGHTKWLHVTKGEAGPEMMIRHWGPDTNIPVHSHPFHEMFYVLEGEIEIGGTTYSAGSCIYIEKNTPYGPTRAPKGGKVLRYAEARPPKAG